MHLRSITARACLLSLIVATLGLLVPCRPATAGIFFIERINDYRLSFSDPQFSDAIGILNVDSVAIWDNAGDVQPRSFTLGPQLQFASWTGGPGLSVEDIVVEPNRVTSNFVATEPYQEPVISRLTVLAFPGSGILTTGLDELENPFLTVRSRANGGVEPGSPMSWSMLIPGDWSRIGTGPGEADLEAINPIWTIDSFFEYDADIDQTLFRAHLDSYFDDGFSNVDIRFTLHGIGAQVVPEPSTIALAGLGTLGLIGIRICNRRRA